jgi:2,5-furandicarboxylate decarboxylase 1
VGIDATIPVGSDFPEVSEVQGWKDFALPEIDKRSI